MSVGNGKTWEVDKYQGKLSVVAAGDTYMWGAKAFTEYVDSVITTRKGIEIVAYSNSSAGGGSPTYDVVVSINGTVIRSISVAAWSATSDVIVTLNNVKCYNLLLGTLHRLVYDSVDIDIDGSSINYAGDTLESYGTGPCYMPILGTPWTLFGPTDFDTDAGGALPENGTIVISGGFRFMKDGVWYELDTTLPPFDSSSGATIPPASIVSTTTTWNGQINCSLEFLGSGSIPPSRGTGIDMSLGLVPDLEKSIVRLGVDPGDMWYRAEFPEVTALDQINVRLQFSESFLGGEEVIYAGEAQFLEKISDLTVSNVEDVLGVPSYCTVNVSSGDKTYTVPFPEYAIGSTMTYTFPYVVTFTGSAYLGHTSPDITYLQYWVNPHWHIFSWWQDWNSILPVDYWQPIREKWMFNAPAGISVNTRNSLIMESTPYESGISPFWDAFTQGLGWVGNHRFDVNKVVPLATYTYTAASSSLWTELDGTAAFGANIVVTPASGNAILELDLGSFSVEPYMWPHIASHLFVNWNLTNVTEIKVYCVGIDGTKKLLELVSGDGFTTRNQTYRIPQSTGTKFGGSWVIDNGFGVVTDDGVDFGVSGMSSTIYGSGEGSGANELGITGTYAKLRFEIECTGNVTLNYPRLDYSPTGDPSLCVENSNCSVLLWENGPGLRFGWADHYVFGLQNPPLVKPLGERQTVVDALCWTNHWLLARAHDFDVAADVTALYDTMEIQALNTADEGTNACLLPNSSALGAHGSSVNDTEICFAFTRNQRETPPVAWMPMQKFNTSTWVRGASAFAQVVYHWSQERRDYISAGSQLDLVDSVFSVRSSPVAGAPAGWFVSSFNDSVSNVETSWQLWADGQTYATSLTPWHGYFGVVQPAEAETFQMLDMDIHSGGDIHVAYLDLNGNCYWRNPARADEIVAVGALWTAIACGESLTFIDVLFAGGARTRYISGGQEITLGTNADMEHFRTAIDDEQKILVVWQDLDGYLFSNYNEEGDIPVNLQVSNLFYDVEYKEGRFVLTANLINYYSYDNGTSWKGL